MQYIIYPRDRAPRLVEALVAALTLLWEGIEAPL